MTKVSEVPQALKISFLFHFAIDMIVALPLFLAPVQVLSLFGWIAIDPFASRLVAAALFAIGLESFLARNASAQTFKGMLQLKLVWSAFAMAGLAWSLLEGGLRYRWIGWLLAGVFGAFHILWWYWFIRLKRFTVPLRKPKVALAAGLIPLFGDIFWKFLGMRRMICLRQAIRTNTYPVEALKYHPAQENRNERPPFEPSR